MSGRAQLLRAVPFQNESMNPLDPHALAERRVQLSAEYARDSELLAEILSKKPEIWMKLREGVKSDTAAERAWERSDLGIQEMRLRLQMKAAEKKMSAART